MAIRLSSSECSSECKRKKEEEGGSDSEKQEEVEGVREVNEVRSWMTMEILMILRT